MKQTKKLMTLVIAMVMMVAMGVTAFAAPDTVPTPGTGTITVNNAARGETYKVYKILDAEVGANGAIVYKGDIPTALSAYLEKNAAGEITLKTGASEADLFAALKTYAAGLEATDTKVAASETVVFNNLAFGYYVITSTQGGGAAISVTSTKPEGVVNEKNVTTPEPHKTVDDVAYSIGDTITYTVTFNGANYRGTNADAKIVTSYDVTDTLPDFLTNVRVTSVTIGEGASATTITRDFNAQKTFNIPWAQWNETDEKWESLYNNGTLVTIVYTAQLTDEVRVGANNTNTITISPKVGNNQGQEEPTDEHWDDDAEIKTYATAIKKVDEDGKPLAGAKFKIQGLTATKGEDGVYTVTAYRPTGDNAISLDNSTELVVDANGMLYIVGLKNALTLSLTETEAPTGYNKLTEAVPVTSQLQSTETYKITGYRKYDAKGNIIEESEETIADGTQVTKNLSDLDATAVEIENNKGTELPSTGGIGTTIFYVIGAILVLGAGILLVTRRRMSAN